jgi:hypothetical protein
VLPDAFAQDPGRLARFEREAKTLASLNHPNIAIIYGLEKADGIRALVMELVEGPTLAERNCEGSPSDSRRAADCEADRRGARSGARARHRSPRSEARQHQAPHRWHGKGSRLRSRESDGAGWCRSECDTVTDDHHHAGDDASRSCGRSEAP